MLDIQYVCRRRRIRLQTFTIPPDITTEEEPIHALEGLTPATPTVTDVPYEMGMKFQSSEAGLITGVRFWRAAGDDTTQVSYVGRLWAADGTQLVDVEFTQEPVDDGWMEASFTDPYEIEADTTYVVSVNSNGKFAVTSEGLATSIVNGVISTVADDDNGVFHTTRGSFPTTSFNNSNYFRDVSYVPGLAPFVKTWGTPAFLMYESTEEGYNIIPGVFEFIDRDAGDEDEVTLEFETDFGTFAFVDNDDTSWDEGGVTIDVQPQHVTIVGPWVVINDFSNMGNSLDLNGTFATTGQKGTLTCTVTDADGKSGSQSLPVFSIIQDHEDWDISLSGSPSPMTISNTVPESVIGMWTANVTPSGVEDDAELHATLIMQWNGPETAGFTAGNSGLTRIGVEPGEKRIKLRGTLQQVVNFLEGATTGDLTITVPSSRTNSFLIQIQGRFVDGDFAFDDVVKFGTTVNFTSS